jgi:hypothetical protein
MAECPLIFLEKIFLVRIMKVNIEAIGEKELYFS